MSFLLRYLYGGYGSPSGSWGVLFYVLVFVFVLLLVMRIIRLFFGPVWRRGGQGRRANKSSLDTLNDRYAKGEISKEEYEERKQVLLGR
jgi:putative membrane protein